MTTHKTPGTDLFLLHPFHHDFADSALVDLDLDATQTWTHWFTRMSEGEYSSALDHSFSFIPPVKAVVFPEFFNQAREHLLAAGRPSDTNVSDVRRRLATTNVDPGNWREHYKYRGLRLTFSAHNLWLDQQIRLEVHEANIISSTAFKIGWVDVLLLPDHVGVLILKVTLEEEDPDLVASISRHIKKIEFRRRLTVDLPDLRLSDGSVCKWADILNILLKDLQRSTNRTSGSTVSYSEYSGSHGANWRLAIVSGLDVASRTSPTMPAFKSQLEQEAFCISIGRSPAQLLNNPSQSLLSSLRTQSSLNPWSSWSCLYNYDNLVFVADVSDQRLSEEYDGHREIFEHEYLILFAIASAQRTSLDLLSGELAAIPAHAGDALERLEALEGNLIRFNTRFWFDQIGTSPIGKPLYSMLCDSMSIDRQHKQVFNDADRLRRHLDALQSRRRTQATDRTEQLLQFLTVVALPLTVYVTLFSPALLRWGPIAKTSPTVFWCVMGAATVVLSCTWLLIRRRMSSNDIEL